MNLKTNVLVVCIIIMFLLLGCSFSSLKPTPTAIPTATITQTLPPTATPLPTFTPTIPATATPEPTAIQALSDTPETTGLQMPEGEPVADWKGIPIMPGAITGEGDEQGYLFSVKASPDEIQKYYENELTQQGWSLMAVSSGSTKFSMEIFTRNEENLSVSIFDAQTDEGVFMVMLVK